MLLWLAGKTKSQLSTLWISDYIRPFLFCLSYWLWSSWNLITDIFRTCHEIYTNYKQVAGQPSTPADGIYLIDPDGDGGLNAFKVECIFPYETRILISENKRMLLTETDTDAIGSYKQCYDIEYSGTSAEQRKVDEFSFIRNDCLSHSHWKPGEVNEETKGSVKTKKF